MEQKYYIYILSSQRNGTLYVGSTSDLIKRVYEHKNKLRDGFTKKHNITMLVYYEQAESRIAAIHRERNIKAWKRKWKLRLIEETNQNWDDLYFKL